MVLLRIAVTTQVLVENYRPGTLEKMGIGPDVLLARNPKLVVDRVSGWGQSGSWPKKPGFGTPIEAFSGFAAMNGFPDRAPVLPAFAMADAFAGLWGATAVPDDAARGRGRRRPRPDNRPVVDRADPRHGRPKAEYRLTRKTTPRLGSRCTVQAPRDVYRTAEGRYVALSTGTEAMAERLFRVIGRPS
jgi:crotonobetainyl-CoA:carnitine CoA-transferase CaiB-like acyl-CoA transferase